MSMTLTTHKLIIIISRLSRIYTFHCPYFLSLNALVDLIQFIVALSLFAFLCGHTQQTVDDWRTGQSITLHVLLRKQSNHDLGRIIIIGGRFCRLYQFIVLFIVLRSVGGVRMVLQQTGAMRCGACVGWNGCCCCNRWQTMQLWTIRWIVEGRCERVQRIARIMTGRQCCGGK